MEFNDTQAIYLQIADYICEQILLEKWATEERIPSVRDLAALMEVNPNTAMRSYEFLQQKEIIYNKRGIGYFASHQAPVRIKAYRKERFLEAELPEFFRTLYLLDISMEEIQERYNAFVRETYPAT
ncbi:GntR family transcriptional regulator [Catalinimonas sp. 4WD22]|uniref:GntR family transcriptional regulator n=1 Tax=Catalinimonas locisalis TaxID=3133978 RepID=UPI0031018556